MDQLRICLSAPLSVTHVEFVWPVIHATEKAWRVQTAGGPVWLPKFKLKIIGGVVRFPSRDALVKFMRDCTSASSDTLHRVWKSGKGPTDKSHKFKIAVIRTKVHSSYPDAPIDQLIVRRAFTLPISQVKKDEDGKWVAPGWLFKDKLDGSEKLARTTWHGMAAVTREIDEAAARLDAKIAQKKADRQAEKERARQEKQAIQAEWESRSAAINNDAALALKFCKARFNRQEMREEMTRLGHSGWMDHWPTIWHPENHYDIAMFERIVAVAFAHPKWGAWRAKQGE